MIIVSDTSPISNLLKIHKVELLHIMYGEIIIPPAVKNELLALKSKKAEVEVFQNESWVKTMEPIEILQPINVNPPLHRGEIEAISLAKELKADWLLMDEKAGRVFAKQHGVKTIGLIGVLLEAKKRNYLTEVMPIVDGLINIGGFWLNESLYKEIKMQANE